jgi:mannose-6-phosphate isomerase-like protein (cupin superfamily)
LFSGYLNISHSSGSVRQMSTTTVNAFALPEGQGEHLRIGPATIVLRATGETTGGALTLFEEKAPLLDTPTHVHDHEDEAYYVVAGDHEFVCGGDTFQVGPGAVVFLPRRIPHSHRRLVPGEGHLLGIAVPAGLDGFFRTIAGGAASGEASEQTYSAASERYGIHWIG